MASKKTFRSEAYGLLLKQKGKTATKIMPNAQKTENFFEKGMPKDFEKLGLKPLKKVSVMKSGTTKASTKTSVMNAGVGGAVKKAKKKKDDLWWTKY